MQTAGRHRTFGLGVGVTMLLAGAAVRAFNGSMTVAYGTDGVVRGAGSMIGVVLAAGLVLAPLRTLKATTARGHH